MTTIKHKLAFLAFAPALFLSTGCDQVIRDITSGEPPPCVINDKTPTCNPPPTIPPPITNPQ